MSSHTFDDESFRKKIALSIGLKEIPDLDPSSFERFSGILSKDVDSKFDARELVKEVRGY